MRQIKKSKKGVNAIVEYVLFVTFAIVLAVLVYSWLKSYVPQEEVNCPDETSILISDYNYDCASNILKINFTNNGKFNIGGYFIHATNSSDVQLATIDLSKRNTDSFAQLNPLGIRFGIIGEINSLEPNDIEMDEYNVTGMGTISSIEILPIRWQKQKNKEALVSCKDIKDKENY